MLDKEQMVTRTGQENPFSCSAIYSAPPHPRQQDDSSGDNTDWYLEQFTIPSTLMKASAPEEENEPQSMMLPPPRDTSQTDSGGEAFSMKKLFSFSKKKQSPSRTTDRGNALSVGYEVKEKDLGKFHKAAWRGDVAKLEHLVKSNDVNQLDKHNRTALHLACACGHAEVVRFLVEKKAKLNLCDNQNRSPLMKAVQGQYELCANILLENHADPNLVDNEGNSALHLASSIPSVSTVDALVDHDADIDAQNKEGISPLTVAVQGDHIEVAEILLKKGAGVNILDRDRRSALMIAAGNGHVSMVRLLLQFHADITLKDNKGHSAEDYAVIEGHHPCAILITEHGAQRNQAASLSHPGPSKKKLKSELGKASRAIETGFPVGGPATDKDDLEENSQAESLSRVSKKGVADEWASSDDDCESLSVEKTPPKMNLRKMLESKRGKAFAVLDKSMSASESDSDNSAPRVASSKPPKPPVGPSPAPFLPKASQMTSTPLLIYSKKEEDENDASHEDPDGDDEEDDDDDEDQGEEEELEEDEEEDISDDQLEGNKSLPDGTTDLPEKRDVSKDAKSGVCSESCLEREEEEQDSCDYEHEAQKLSREDQQTIQAQNTVGEKMEDAGLGAVPSVAESKDTRDVQKEDPTQKENEETKWGLLLSKCEGKSKEKTDLMEELGLGDFDYAEDASDWDTSSNISKKSLPG
ncbi:POTE ankyrin domain family member B2-like, partial [Hippocampus comes]|uniref:POTE ankyrin domain family member B2-like n=1 Tax=Hippocampus comes TaxID=109280 RepID=UPI00094E035D